MIMATRDRPRAITQMPTSTRMTMALMRAKTTQGTNVATALPAMLWVLPQPLLTLKLLAFLRPTW